MVEVVENYDLDLLHVHYAMPFAASAYLARQLMLPRQLGVVTTLHGTDITVVGVEPAFFRVTQFSIQSSDRVTAVSRFLKERAEESFGITRPIEVIYNFVDPKVFAPRRRRTLRLAPPETRVLMHASNFRPVKNIPAVIQVFAEVRQPARTRSWSWSATGPRRPGPSSWPASWASSATCCSSATRTAWRNCSRWPMSSCCRAPRRASGWWRSRR